MKKLTGFTIIELMIVIAIVGILAAVIIPAISENSGSNQSGGSGQQQTIKQCVPPNC